MLTIIYRLAQSYIPGSETSHWYTRFEQPDGLLVIVGVITCIIIAWQAVETRKAAQAAAINVAALVNSERAWVMVGVRFESLGLLQNGVRGDTTGAVVRLTCKNSGPTPAWIFEQHIRMEVKPEVVASKIIVPSPQFPGGPVGGATQVNYRILPVTASDDPYEWEDVLLQCDGWATPANGLHTYIYGVVRYRDAFSSLRETYFGYYIMNNTLQRIPNEAYNKHT